MFLPLGSGLIALIPNTANSDPSAVLTLLLVSHLIYEVKRRVMGVI